MDTVKNLLASLPLSLVDLGAALFLLLDMALGRKRGLSGQLGALLGSTASLAAALLGRTYAAGWLTAHARLDSRAADAVAYISLLVLALVAAFFVRKLLGGIAKLVFDPRLDKPAGLLAGLLNGLVLVLAVFLAMNVIPHGKLNRMFGDDSAVGRLVLRFVPWTQATADPAGTQDVPARDAI